MNCEPVRIRLREGEAPPPPVLRSKPTPFHWVDKTKRILTNLEEQGIITRAVESSNFCSPSFCVAKPSDPAEPRLVVDFTNINKKINRPYHPMGSVKEAWRKIPPGMKYFCTVDLSASYWQIPVDQNS